MFDPNSLRIIIPPPMTLEEIYEQENNIKESNKKYDEYIEYIKTKYKRRIDEIQEDLNNIINTHAMDSEAKKKIRSANRKLENLFEIT